jgi:hypothetical protein
LRFVYIDPTLCHNLGHHANSCRQVVTAATRRGLSLVVLAHENIDLGLAKELGALPFFRRGTYDRLRSFRPGNWLTRSGRIDLSRSTKWLRFVDRPRLGILRRIESFERAVGIMADDLQRFNFSGQDIVFFNSAQVVEIAAILRYLVSLPARNRPTFFVEFFLSPGVKVQFEKKELLRIVDRNLISDPRPAFYRMVGAYWSHLAEPLPIHCITFDHYASQVFAKLIGRTVSTFPLPRLSITNRRSRAGANPPTIGIMGQQRPDKGYHLVPQIIRHVLTSRPSTQFLVHNADPWRLEQVQIELRRMADLDQRIEMDERVADEVIWKELLERVDLIVCPYDANRFRSSYSAVASEAASDAIPAVVPTDTSLSEMIAGLEGGYTTFDSWDARSIADATIEAIDGLDVLAEKANSAAARWPIQQGPDQLVEVILKTME